MQLNLLLSFSSTSIKVFPGVFSSVISKILHEQFLSNKGYLHYYFGSFYVFEH